jgi:hypothetical protein
MEKQLQDLLENEMLGEDARKSLQEAFEQKLQQAEAKLQESYATRFEHERAVLVEAMDKMLNDVVRKELTEFAQDRTAVAKQKVRLAQTVNETRKVYRLKLNQNIQLMEQFMTREIEKEVLEFREDKKLLEVQRRTMAKELNRSRKAEKSVLEAKIAKLENFVLQQLSQEIAEFHSDKRALVEQRVKLATESKKKLEETQSRFVARASSVVNRTLNEVIRKELVQWRDDIKVARENNFGRKIFEAVAAEFMTSYLSEGTQVKKLANQLTAQGAQLAEAQVQLAQKQRLLESEQRSSAAARAQVQRAQVLNELLSPLARDKKKVMADLLSDVKTSSLKESFTRYLPTVINQTVTSAPRAAVTHRGSTVAHSGDRAPLMENTQPKEDNIDLQNILYLAGLVKSQ